MSTSQRSADPTAAPANTAGWEVNARLPRITSEAIACPPRCPITSMTGLTRLRISTERGTYNSSIPVRCIECRRLPSVAFRSSARGNPPTGAT